jgi:hypothetical protein
MDKELKKERKKGKKEKEKILSPYFKQGKEEILDD